MRQVITFNNKNWTLPAPLPPPPLQSVFYLEAKESSSVGLYRRGGAWTTFEYSTDNENWSDFNTSTQISLATGDKAYFRAKQTRDTSSSDSDKTWFSISGNVKASGNIMMLYDYEHPENMTLTHSYAFANLFCDHSTGLTDVKDLIMPNVLSTGCCGNMFLGSRITSSPILPALTLVSKCYEGMFANIPTLTDITMLATDISASGCLTNWLYGSPNTGAQTLYKNPNISRSAFSSGISGIPSNWNVVDY